MPTDHELDQYVEHAAKVLGIPMRAEWIAAVRENLAVTLKGAAAVQEFPLPDDSEPAPVFGA